VKFIFFILNFNFNLWRAFKTFA